MTKMPAEKVTKCENRRSNKPLMEKRRRARINQSLSELKNLILDAIKKDSSRNSKLEKADILEMAVKHLQNLQKQQQANNVASTSESNSGNKYRAGFNECATEVTRFLDKMEGLDTSVRGRLINHLFNCLNDLCSESSKRISTTTGNEESSSNSEPCSPTDNTETLDKTMASDDRQSPSLSCGIISTTQPIQVHIPTSSIPLALVPQARTAASQADTPPTDNPHSSERAATIVHGLQLIPTRLSNGEIAFVLDNQSIRTSEALTAVSQSLTLATNASLPVAASRSAPLVTSTSHSVSSSEGSPPKFPMELGDGQEAMPLPNRAAQDVLKRVIDRRNGQRKVKRVHPPHLHGPLQIKEENVWRPW